MIGYEVARSTVAAAIQAALGDWTVFDHPADAMDDNSVAVGVGPSRRLNDTIWQRDLLVGVFVRRSSVAEGLDELDVAVPTIAALDLDGYTTGDVSEPRAVTIADTEFLMQVVPVTIETTG